jgi:phosphoribosylglycinamide formyltransferase 1
MWLAACCYFYNPMHRLIIFSSGRGSNAQAIINYFRNEGGAEVVLIVCNKPEAGVLKIAATEAIPTLLTSGKAMNEERFLETVQSYQPTLIVLAGFLLKIPEAVIEAFRERIINVHPALLPRHGGKGMWGQHVHQAVLDSRDVQTGISIHLVDEEYDHGATLLQATCKVEPGDDAYSLAKRVQALEHYYYPRAIQFLLCNRHV